MAGFYIVRSGGRQVVYQGEADRGEPVELNARDDRVTIGGRTVMEPAAGRRHSVPDFLRADEPRARGAYRERVWKSGAVIARSLSEYDAHGSLAEVTMPPFEIPGGH